ncbi:MAG TPA: glycoside hydrolase family 43 protein [Blastocatellia bacterium]|nr:glycoside hydrolase family 43 protein [Blastocatellia bacterium]
MITYLNPVHNRPCPDPFVLKHCGEYWCYVTGVWHDGRCFGVLRSRDLVGWREMAGAMEPLDASATCYWAPEVVYRDGRFFMYYSVGNEERMQIRVAVAAHPAGPFVDSRRRLTHEDFAIDPHVFEDDDGGRYMFYATDFLTHTHVGTGTVVDRMVDPFTLAGNPRPVTRARFDWQVYDPNRAEKGGVRWHTVEGPFVLKRKGLYYEMFSGGNWKDITYGVSYAVTDDINTPDEWAQVADGRRVMPVLRTLPGEVIGPGHNSVVRGPDNMQLFCVYHRWAEDGSGRVLSIDRQDWAGERLIVLGPSVTPQPAPTMPALTGFFDRDGGGLGDEWNHYGGDWTVRDGAAVQETAKALEATASHTARVPYFILELSLRAFVDVWGEGDFGIILSGGAEALRVSLVPKSNEIVIGCRTEAGLVEQRLKLQSEFDMRSYHHLRVEANGNLATIALDGTKRWQTRTAEQPVEFKLFTRRLSAAFAGLALAVGWEDLFTEQTIHPSDLGWRVQEPGGNWRIRDRELWNRNEKDQHSAIAKGPMLESYELVVNARIAGDDYGNGAYGFYPLFRPQEPGPLLTVERTSAGWALKLRADSGSQAFSLPAQFDPYAHQQFRFRKQKGWLMIQWGAQTLGEVEVADEPACAGLFARGATAAFDMVRVTAIADKI